MILAAILNCRRCSKAVGLWLSGVAAFKRQGRVQVEKERGDDDQKHRCHVTGDACQAGLEGTTTPGHRHHRHHQHAHHHDQVRSYNIMKLPQARHVGTRDTHTHTHMHMHADTHTHTRTTTYCNEKETGSQQDECRLIAMTAIVDFTVL